MRSSTWLRFTAPWLLWLACGDGTAVVPDGRVADGGAVPADGGDGGSGCVLTFTAPSTTVTSDADANAIGVQANVVVRVGGCAAPMVTLSDCDVGDEPLNATVQNGVATFSNVTLCALDVCPRIIRTCKASSGSTAQTAALTVDTQPPLLTLVAVQPAGVCGGSVAMSDDVDPQTNGIQVQLRLLGIASSRWLEQTPPAGGSRIEVDATGLATVSLTSGENSILAKGIDESGLAGTSAPCVIDATNLRVAITEPAQTALGRANGAVETGGLALRVCGTVGEPATSTVTITVDGANPVAAVIDNVETGHFCAAHIVVPEGVHELAANGSSTTGDAGKAKLQLVVDLSAPPPPTELQVTRLRRNALTASWTAPSDVGGKAVAHCVVKKASHAIADAAAFDAITAIAADVPGTTPGAPQTATLSAVKPGVATSVALRCYDAAGNGSDVRTTAATTLRMTTSPTLTPTSVTGFDTTNAQFGRAMAGADLNGDGFNDLVVGAPGACKPGATCTNLGVVYVYMGSAAGVAATPSFVIRGTDATGNGYLGKSLAALDWNNDGVSDLAIGAPFSAGLAGTVFIFFGDKSETSRWKPAASTTFIDDTSADVTMTPDQTDDWLRGTTTFGWELRALDSDGDGRDDLLIGAPGAGAFKGGAVVVFGPQLAKTGTIAFPGGLAAAGTSARGYVFGTAFPELAQYGNTLASLGRLGDGATPSGDTRDDFVVAPLYGSTSVLPTLVVFYGAAQSGTPWTKVDATTAGNEFISGPVKLAADRFAIGLGSVNDQNGDGRRELLVSDTTYGTGVVWVVPAGIPGSKALPDAALAGLNPSATAVQYGAAIAPAGNARVGGDLDGDGIDDIIVGANSPSSLWLWYGDTNLATGAFADTYLGPAAFTAGNTAAWLGDINGDGQADLAWGDTRTGQMPQTGAIQVLY